MSIFDDEKAEYANIIVQNSKGTVDIEDAMKFVSIVSSSVDKSKKQILEQFDILTTELINKYGAINSIFKISYLLGVMNSNNIINEMEMRDLSKKYSNDVINQLKNKS